MAHTERPIPVTQSIHLAAVDWLILILYFAFVVGIGVALKRGMKSSTDFFMSGRNIPAWISGLAFLSANLGAQEVMGMAASGAKYGMMTAHFYWLGAVPAIEQPPVTAKVGVPPPVEVAVGV